MRRRKCQGFWIYQTCENDDFPHWHYQYTEGIYGDSQQPCRWLQKLLLRKKWECTWSWWVSLSTALCMKKIFWKELTLQQMDELDVMEERCIRSMIFMKKDYCVACMRSSDGRKVRSVQWYLWGKIKVAKVLFPNYMITILNEKLFSWTCLIIYCTHNPHIYQENISTSHFFFNNEKKGILLIILCFRRVLFEFFYLKIY